MLRIARGSRAPRHAARNAAHAHQTAEPAQQRPHFVGRPVPHPAQPPHAAVHAGCGERKDLLSGVRGAPKRVARETLSRSGAVPWWIQVKTEISPRRRSCRSLLAEAATADDDTERRKPV